MANNTPDFDKMSPEEIMKWMETLAKRQGASEGMTTEANAEIADIDPDSVVIDEPGYVPSEGKMKGKKIETIIPPRKTSEQAPAAAAAPPVQQPAAQAPAAPPPVQQPAAQAPAAPPAPAPQPAAEPAGLSWLESLAADQGADFPALDLSSLGAELTPAATSAPAESQTNPIDWLESLGKSEAPAEANPVDWLQDLGAPAEVTAPAEEAPALANPIDWLQDLGAPAEVTSSASSGVADPFASGADPVNWLESLAKGQGAKEEELTTSADLSVPPPPEDAAVDGPGYTPYSFDTPSFTPRQPEIKMPVEATPEPAEVGDTALEDPSAWLDQLASSQGFDPRKSTGETKAAAPAQMSDKEIQEALAKGLPVPHDQMEAWMNRQLEVGAQREEPPELFGGEEYDPDAPAVPAEIPDWLIEQVGSAPPEDAQPPVVEPPTPQPALIEDILEPPAVAEMPDWLKEEAPSSDLDSIFATPTMELPPPELTPLEPAKAVSELEIDTSDPWVEAFDTEYKQGSVDINQVPDWYAKAVTDPTRAAAADRAASGEAVELADAGLQPETQLPEGEPENVPDWLSGLATGAVEAEAVPAEDIPDWLKADFQPTPPAAVAAPAAPVIQADVAAAEDVPDWLKGVDLNEVPAWLTETLGTNTSEQSVVQPVQEPPSVMIPAVPVAPAAPPAVPAAQSPAPVPVAVAQIDAASVLSAARSRVQAGDIEGGLSQYEQLVRANSSLQETVDDLSKVAEKTKNSPALYRVLGDAYMRTGKLQAALDTYRKALNQL
jgi:hypothetical protein